MPREANLTSMPLAQLAHGNDMLTMTPSHSNQSSDSLPLMPGDDHATSSAAVLQKRHAPCRMTFESSRCCKTTCGVIRR